MAKALRLTGGEDVEESARLAEMMDKFFDCVNVHNYTQGYHRRKPFLDPYRSSKDRRLKVTASIHAIDLQYLYTSLHFL